MTPLDQHEALQRVGQARIARLATTNAAGRPHIVPVVFALVDDERIVTAVDHKPKSTQRLKRLDNIARNPEVSLLADHYDEDWSRLWWVRIDGTAQIAAEPSEREKAIDHLAGKYPQYMEHRPDGPVIEIAVESITSWWPGR